MVTIQTREELPMPAANGTAARRVALLIDADNVSVRLLPQVLVQAAELGSLVVRRAYGNATTWAKVSVRNFVKAHAVTPVLVIAASNRKDAADWKLAMDATDLLHRGVLDALCIASSDGDFTPLAVHLRENGLAVYGLGEAKTPEPYQAALDRFSVIGREAPAKTEKAVQRTRTPPALKRLLAPRAAPAERPGPTAPKAPKMPVPEAEIIAKVDGLKRADGWADLGTLGRHLNERPDKFDPRRYGYRSLRDLVAAVHGLEMSETKSPGGNSVVRVRQRQGA
jgi:hypothetical protein